MLLEPLKRNARRQRVLRDKTIPAPVEGWDASSPLAAMKETRAVELENWFPQPGYVEIRKGLQFQSFDIGTDAITVTNVNTGTDVLTANAHGFIDGEQVKVHASTTIPAGLSETTTYYIRAATANTFELALTSGGTAVDITSVGAGTITAFSIEDRPDVESLMSYQGPGATQKLFAAAGSSIWDCSASGYARFSTGSGLGSNRWQDVNFGTSGGNFLFIVNGTDAPRYYDGSAWTTPTITGTGITASDFIHITAHKERLWFVIKDTTDLAYMGTSAVSGTATKFPMGQVFKKGGYIVACESWTLDGGSGPDDYFVVITSRGQVAVYQGTDPASASTWALVGVYDVGEPIGRRCTVKYGTTPLIITRSGLIKLQMSLSNDKAELEGTAFSARIYNAFTMAARTYDTNFGWQSLVYPRGNMLLVNIPISAGAISEQYVANTLTGAWTKFTGWNVLCMEVFNDKLYLGGLNGIVYEADRGANDVGATIQATGQMAYNDFGSDGRTKRFAMLKALVRSTSRNRPQLGVSTDFVETFSLSTLPTTDSTGSLWDVFQWDVGTWAGTDQNISDWSSISALGTWGSLKFVAQTGGDTGGSAWGVSTWGGAEWGGSTSDETMQINGFVVTFEAGEYL